VILGIISIASLIALAAVAFRSVDFSQFVIYYGNKTRELVVYVAGAITLILAGTGLGFGFNSAGERRNDKPHLSWLGFFISAGVLCSTLIVLFLFYSRKEFIG